MVQVVECDLLPALRCSKSSGVSIRTGAGKVALSELTLISLRLQGEICNSVMHQSHSVGEPAFSWSGVGRC